ncbi:MAG: hypothetical protein RL376_104 [Verrucomicrobiota bacterium]|jgi:hypothetical protein
MNASHHAIQAEKYAQLALDYELLAHLADERGDNIAARAHTEKYESMIELSKYHAQAAMPTIHSAAPAPCTVVPIGT